MDISRLKDEGYISIAYPQSLKDAIREAVEAWGRFCALPEEQKLRFSYTPDSAVGSGVGYELKKGKDGADLKENFHIRASQRPFLIREASKVGLVALDFVQTALNAKKHLLPVVLEFAQAVQLQYGVERFRQDVLGASLLSTLRFLHYFPTNDPEATMAAQHTDKGGFTPHLWESAAGLQRLTFEEDAPLRSWTPMPVSHDEMVIFSGLRMQLRSKNQLKATCHRVVANAETARMGRTSAVAFIDFLNTPYFDKERLGHTQAMAPGFNYDMPFGTFRELFKAAKVANY